MNKKSPARPAFTLVELLVVMAIIGVLVGMILAAIGPVRTALRVMQQGTDVANLKRAVDAYHEKIGDYPPDFADLKDAAGVPQAARFPLTVAYRHITKFYPNIAPEELQTLQLLLNTNPAYFDHATVLTFFLGGLSDDSKYPFSGPGGPLSGNTDRNEPLMTFDQSRILNSAYYPQNARAPYVYFDARTYDYVADNAGNRAFAHFNWTTPDGASMAHPYKSTEVNPANATQPADRYFHYVNRESYQIISPGLDDNFGIPMAFDDGTGTMVPVFIIFPNMLPFHPVLYDAASVTGGAPVPPAIAFFADGHKDNIADFSGGGKLEDRKP